ncbi:endonuclease domain-containing protein [Planktothrix pseudagardhii]|uniref:DUF559 domain-containing protein n=1 Tax=Planktothrix pseudagardhii TaxID=132604 RepID=A0A9W4CFZ8_9CYAN|nr:endonuclease domain-containing protein [Planktothrix pseudagardhii]CAD5926242.1 hypothetical protein NO713_00990 [Planktothrix pseudagardhii]
MNSVRGFYPVILIPDSIRYFCINNPIPVLNSSPNSVAEFSSEIKLSSKEYIYPSSCLYGVIVIWVVSVVIVLLVNQLFGMSILAFWLSLICASVSAVTACFYLRFVNFKLCQQYQPKLTKNQQKISNSKSNLLHRLQHQNQKIEQYNNLLEDRSKKLLFLLSKIVQPPSNQGNTGVQQGVSEKQFFIYLCRYFSGVYDFCMGVEFPIPNTSFCYTADFILIHQATGLAIDIEIDEPYDGKTGKPHHCVDQNKDQQRNRFFLERNWVVIRFSEYQVVKCPEGCCKAIAQVIFQITGDYSGLIKLQSIKDLLPHKQWKNKEAVYMAKTKFRQSYLKNNFLL